MNALAFVCGLRNAHLRLFAACCTLRRGVVAPRQRQRDDRLLTHSPPVSGCTGDGGRRRAMGALSSRTSSSETAAMAIGYTSIVMVGSIVWFWYYKTQRRRAANARGPKLAKTWSAKCAESEIVLALAVNPQSDTLATASGSAVRLWSLPQGNELGVLEMDDNGASVLCLAWSNDGTRLACGLSNATLHIWNVQDGLAEHVLVNGHDLQINAAVFLSARDDRLISVGSDNGLVVWKLPAATVDVRVEAHTAPVMCVVAKAPQANNNNNTFATCSADKTIKLWSLGRTEPDKVLRKHREVVTRVAYAADGTMLVSAGWDWKVHVWSLDTFAVVVTFDQHLFSVKCLGVGDARMVASSAGDGKTLCYTLEGIVVAEFDYEADALAFSPQGKLLVTVRDDCIKTYAW